MRLDQSASEAATLTLARPLAARTDNVSHHVEENLALDQKPRPERPSVPKDEPIVSAVALGLGGSSPKRRPGYLWRSSC